MNEITKKRMVENETAFRAANEKVEKIIEKDFDSKSRKKIVISFVCECSNLDCTDRVKMQPDTYKRLHQYRDQFVIIRGHETPAVERTIKRSKHYSLVEKFALSPN